MTIKRGMSAIQNKRIVSFVRIDLSFIEKQYTTLPPILAKNNVGQLPYPLAVRLDFLDCLNNRFDSHVIYFYLLNATSSRFFHTVQKIIIYDILIRHTNFFRHIFEVLDNLVVTADGNLLFKSVSVGIFYSI